MQKIKNLLLNREIMLYLLFGVLTTVVNYVSYYIFTRYLQLDVLLANGLAWILSVLFAYITNKIYVFQSKTTSLSDLGKEFMLFISARIGSGVFDMLIVYLFVDVFGMSDLVIKLISNVVVIIANWAISKLFIFKGQPTE